MMSWKMRPALLFSALLLPSSSAQSLGRSQGAWCGQFHWNEDLKGVKLLVDCDLLKDQLTLKDAFRTMADKTECIKYICLSIGEPVWENNDGRSLDRKNSDI